MASTSREFYESVITQALEQNQKLMSTWSKYRNDLNTTKHLINMISKKLTNNVMVPIGPKALIPGKIVHTNEFLVNLGETWFVKKSAHQTIEVCNRRIKNCAEMLERLEKERKFMVNKNILPVEREAFGNEERFEIIEYISEEEYQKSKKTHKIVKDQCKQKLVDSSIEQKKPMETEGTIGANLDEMELHEFENELKELNSACSITDDPDKILLSSSLFIENENIVEDLNKDIKENLSIENKNMKSLNVKKGVTFACDLDSSDSEPLRLEIKHSEVNIKCSPSNEEINSPADIFNHYIKLVNKKPLSVLKPSSQKNNVINNNVDLIGSEVDNDEEGNLEDKYPISLGVQLHDISERNVFNKDSIQEVIYPKTKKISKFKASRKKF